MISQFAVQPLAGHVQNQVQDGQDSLMRRLVRKVMTQVGQDDQNGMDVTNPQIL